MQNAFEILGATPLDNNEKLQELFEEKQLLLDNDAELADAYSSLTNPKKRIKHEIEYFAKEEFEPFNTIFVENADPEQKMNLDDTCSAIINIGEWFDSDIHSIYTQINDNREISGFSKLNNSSVVSTAINDLRTSCVNAVTKYFEFIDEKGLVKLFNELVEYEDFTSFFVDELMAHYEIKMTDSLQSKQKICTEKFAEIEKRCDIFNNGGVLSNNLEDLVSEFKKAMSAWDKFAQPLQVNAQQHGATHEASLEFVRNIRNKIIDFSNKSQESFTQTLQSAQYSYNAKETVTQKIADSVVFADIIIKLLDVLKNAFAEDELTADRLKKDKKDITELKKTLQELLNKFDPYGRYKPVGETAYTPRLYGNHGYKNSSWNTPYDKWWKYALWLLLLPLYGAGLIVMLVKLHKDGRISKGVGWVIGIAVLVAIIAISTIISSATYKPFEGSLTTNNFDRAFTVSGSANTSGFISYTIKPKDSKYAQNAKSSDTITVTVHYKFSGGASGGKTGTEEVVLKKSNGYEASGAIYFYVYSWTNCRVTVSYVAPGAEVYLE